MATVLFDEENVALNKRIKEQEMQRDILKKLWPFSADRCKGVVWACPFERNHLCGRAHLPGAGYQPQQLLRLAFSQDLSAKCNQ